MNPHDLIDRDLGELVAAAAERRDRIGGRRVTYSPKMFLPLTNLCRDFCDYCAFRRSPKDPGAHTMSPAEVGTWLGRARAQGCTEALFCLGDRPEAAFPTYQRMLAGWGFTSTVDYLRWACGLALECGLLPHTNAGVLTRAEMRRLKPVNASIGLMLESTSERLCGKGMVHHHAPDKRPSVRLTMTREAGELRIPFTSGLLLGIGETWAERVDTLVAIRDLHRQFGHIQEVIVQPFRAHANTALAGRPQPGDDDTVRAIAIARLILDEEVAVQTPPNLSPGALERLLDAGASDLGGISPITPDYINPRHPWPHLRKLEQRCAAAGYQLLPRLPIHDSWMQRDGFVAPAMLAPIAAARGRLEQPAPQVMAI
jgi:FO synthase